MTPGGQVVCRRAAPQDMSALTVLWEEVFGDGKARISTYFETFIGVDNVYVAGIEGEAPAAMLNAVPCQLGAQQGVYLFALATAPRWRGKGLMGRLMRYAEEDARASGCAFACLIPASPSLYTYYGRHGYDAVLSLRWLHVRAGGGTNGAQGVLQSRPLNAENFLGQRSRWQKAPCVAFSQARTAVIAEDLAEAGAELFTAEDGYAVYAKVNGQGLIAELGGKDNAALDRLVNGLCAHKGLGGLWLSLPEGMQYRPDEGCKRPCAMGKSLVKNSAVLQGAYLRFGLDELALPAGLNS